MKDIIFSVQEKLLQTYKLLTPMAQITYSNNKQMAIIQK